MQLLYLSYLLFYFVILEVFKKAFYKENTSAN